MHASASTKTCNQADTSLTSAAIVAVRILEQTTAPPPPLHVIQDYVGPSGAPQRAAPSRRSTLSASLHFSEAATMANRRSSGPDSSAAPQYDSRGHDSSPPTPGVTFCHSCGSTVQLDGRPLPTIIHICHLQLKL